MRNNYPLIFSRSGAEHSFLSASESEISQELQAVYSPIYEELETGRELEATEKDVQTLPFDIPPLPRYPPPRFTPIKRPIVGSRLVLEGKSLGQTQVSTPKHKVVRLKQGLRRTAPQVRSVSAQRSSTQIASAENLQTYETSEFRIGKAELPPTFPISIRRTAIAGALVTSKTKRGAILEAASSLFATEKLDLVLAFQPRSQVYSAAFVGENAPLTRCCRETVILELSKSGEMRVKCNNPNCFSLQILHLSSSVRQKLWVEESLRHNSRLSNSLSLFIQRGAFKIRPIRKELDRVKYQRSRPQTTVSSLSTSQRRGKMFLTVPS
jgi:hypothetical protein